jgi:hypothetical protein
VVIMTKYYDGTVQLELRSDSGFDFVLWSAFIDCSTLTGELKMKSSSWKGDERSIVFACNLKISSSSIAEFLQCLSEYDLGIEPSCVRRIKLVSTHVNKVSIISCCIAVEPFEQLWEQCVQQFNALFPPEFRQSLEEELTPWHVAQVEWRKPWTEY